MKRAALLSSLVLLLACGTGLPDPPLLPAPPEDAEVLDLEPELVPVARDDAVVATLIDVCAQRCPEATECFAAFNGVACGDCVTGFRAEGDACVFDEESVADHMNVGFDDRVNAWADRDMVRVNDAPFPKQIGSVSLKSVWINDRTMLLASGELTTVADVYARVHFSSETPIAAPLPVGTLLIHQTVGGAPFNGVMVKRGEGEWWYGKYDYSGNPVPLEGWGGSLTCTDCHMPGSDEHPHDLTHIDLLFGVPRDTVVIDE
jgi:hypothetical protein